MASSLDGEAGLFALGLLVLVLGGEFFVSGALGMGRLLRISTWTLGATVVAFATSAPELAVNVIAAAKGHTEISFGNVIGSNLANVGLILGLSAVLRPIPIGSHALERRFLILTLVAVLGLVLEDWWHAALIGLTDACILLAGFVYYLASLKPRGRPVHESSDVHGVARA